jgi:ABC-2 type transport system permease protein
MKKEYSQYKAMMAITRGSLRAIFRSPSAVVFSIAFPLIFILVFGFIGGGSRISLNVAFDKNTDTTNPIYPATQKYAGINMVKDIGRRCTGKP